MDAIWNSFLLVFVSEMGDKTQLLALVLAARFNRSHSAVMAGILVATLLNHGLASYVGTFIHAAVPAEILKWILALSFIGFGLWMLIPDKDEELKTKNHMGPFLTTTIAFFFAEMADKTQFATIALAAKYAAPLTVTFGTTLAMLAADGLAVFFGRKFTDRVPMRWVHGIACALFVLSGVGVFFWM